MILAGEFNQKDTGFNSATAFQVRDVLQILGIYGYLDKELPAFLYLAQVFLAFEILTPLFDKTMFT